ncbi:uncharacterized protein MONOS_17783 [Monocercomonoides exilis]|uniref:uncharacterized protein n=1 Tax=Monocercomonoides exilis TaxID=2049356 RepID=UPI00355A73D0|nr:hypothetical protein MONOS_17783 [Monocercomonoides exilis]
MNIFAGCTMAVKMREMTVSEIFDKFVPSVLKVALKKEESEEIQKEVEIALLSLSNIGYCKVRQEQYYFEIKEILKYHQEHHNLTHLAYQSAWQFFIYRFFNDNSLEDTISNELHFGREATRELEELEKCELEEERKGNEQRRSE